ncbi:MAG: DNA-3-methyladenine glycosylase [Fusobacteria bacterium]|nr:DNA-3-methyladenine glycosylase [Fusobacteriota bacterium]
MKPEEHGINYGLFLLGCLISHKTKNGIVSGIISEVEAYLGPEDKASHGYNNRYTKRTEAMYKKQGTIYIYRIYGKYYCLNIVADPITYPSALLIRSVTFLPEYLDNAALNRYQKNFSALTSYQKKNLANGPGKVTIALGIPQEYNLMEININTFMIKKEYSVPESKIYKLPRINIPYAQDYVSKPWRFKIDPDYLSKLIVDNHK